MNPSNWNTICRLAKAVLFWSWRIRLGGLHGASFGRNKVCDLGWPAYLEAAYRLFKCAVGVGHLLMLAQMLKP